MNVKESYAILRLKHGATLEEVKTSFRRLAFQLHPDLNQDNPHAGRQFQRLNEAYVLLRETLAREPGRGAKAGSGGPGGADGAAGCGLV